MYLWLISFTLFLLACQVTGKSKWRHEASRPQLMTNSTDVYARSIKQKRPSFGSCFAQIDKTVPCKMMDSSS